MTSLKDFLSLPLISIKGVGQHTAFEFEKIDIFDVFGLLMTKARRIERRDQIRSFSSIQDSGIVNTFVKVIQKNVLPSNVLKVTVEDVMDNSIISASKTATLWCFGRNFLSRFLKIGVVYYLYGKAVQKDSFSGHLNISSFEVKPAFRCEDSYSSQWFGTIKNIYVSNPMLNSKISISIRQALSMAKSYDNDLEFDAESSKKYSLLPLKDAFHAYHFPKNIEMSENGRRSLAFFELSQIKESRYKSVSSPIRIDSFKNEEKDLISSLGFCLSPSQERTVFDIFSDLECDKSVFRLLQGEVGSGKTICAVIACFHEFLKGNQSTIIAPTEILAYQHFLVTDKVLKGRGVRIAFLHSRLKRGERNAILHALSEGELDILIGTHSVLSSGVMFKRLSFAAIDEEQRFGVREKQSILLKGKGVKVLFMSATPIPRSLMKILSQGYECSTLETFRTMENVRTRLVGQNRRMEAYAMIKSEFLKGNCAYFVVPRIEEEESDLKSVEELEAELCDVFPGVGHVTISSKTKEEDKKNAIDSFLFGEAQYLISTNMVEVGMDNHKATCIVVEDADMFGLSSLHQLRGRVGRGGNPSWCFLVYRDGISESGKKRLRAIRNEIDGFKIAEMDLAMRGGGDVIGFRQSGETAFKFFDYAKDQDFLIL